MKSYQYERCLDNLEKNIDLWLNMHIKMKNIVKCFETKYMERYRECIWKN